MENTDKCGYKGWSLRALYDLLVDEIALCIHHRLAPEYENQPADLRSNQIQLEGILSKEYFRVTTRDGLFEEVYKDWSSSSTSNDEIEIIWGRLTDHISELIRLCPNHQLDFEPLSTTFDEKNYVKTKLLSKQSSYHPTSLTWNSILPNSPENPSLSPQFPYPSHDQAHLLRTTHKSVFPSALTPPAPALQ